MFRAQWKVFQWCWWHIRCHTLICMFRAQWKVFQWCWWHIHCHTLTCMFRAQWKASQWCWWCIHCHTLTYMFRAQWRVFQQCWWLVHWHTLTCMFRAQWRVFQWCWWHPTWKAPSLTQQNASNSSRKHWSIWLTLLLTAQLSLVVISTYGTKRYELMLVIKMSSFSCDQDILKGKAWCTCDEGCHLHCPALVFQFALDVQSTKRSTGWHPDSSYTTVHQTGANKFYSSALGLDYLDFLFSYPSWCAKQLVTSTYLLLPLVMIHSNACFSTWLFQF